MKIKGKKVIEIRPMTRGEYDQRHYMSERVSCAKRFGLEKSFLSPFCEENGKALFCEDCKQRFAKVNGKYIILVRCEK